MSLKPFVLRILEDVQSELQMTLSGTELEQIMWRPSPSSNSMAWLAWHIARLQDARAAALANTEQRWVFDGWHDRFELPPDPTNHGRGHTEEEADAVRPESVEALSDYARVASESLVGEIEKLEDLVSDTKVSGYSGDSAVRDLVFRAVHGGLAHVGQLMYVRGLVEKRRWFPR